MLLGGYLITRSEGQKMTNVQGSVSDSDVCATIQTALNEMIGRCGGTMETIQWPKAIPDLENSAFIVVSGVAPFSEEQFVALGRDHERLPQLPITPKALNIKRYLDLLRACQLFDLNIVN